MQSLVKILSLSIIALMICFPATAAVEGNGSGPVAEQSQHESTLFAAMSRTNKHVNTIQPTQLAQSKTSLHKHTKTHPAAILLLVMAIAGVFLFPALLERCSPHLVNRFRAPERG